MLVQKSYQYELIPNGEQVRKMKQFCGCCRFVFNRGLEEVKKYYETTGHFYTTTKNKRTMPGKLEIKKFDPVARKHVIYKETKLK